MITSSGMVPRKSVCGTATRTSTTRLRNTTAESTSTGIRISRCNDGWKWDDGKYSCVPVPEPTRGLANATPPIFGGKPSLLASRMVGPQHSPTLPNCAPLATGGNARRNGTGTRVDIALPPNLTTGALIAIISTFGTTMDFAASPNVTKPLGLPHSDGRIISSISL
ncbi:hypothetical protein B0J17DRAFT_631106 [Rhizoctonia solani]|nr:hypothetical protein B0J17DRAFT_631106 [Rhizoctonia solani]